MKPLSNHWADINAAKIIRERPDKDPYICASGITPSGTIHIGNFREIISVDLVHRAILDAGRKARFIYSWDDYDVFRKVPKNMPKQDVLKDYLRKPIVHVPDTRENKESYARANEVELENQLHIVGIDPEYIYQAAQYKNSLYAQGIKKALEERGVIRAVLDEHRSTPLPADWWPLSIFCGSCDKDETEVRSWDGDFRIEYTCSSCGNMETVDLRETSLVKLPWRVDWPMRWQYEGVDFEPAGKEHHSAGGSYDTASQIAKQVYNIDPPVSFKYDFISIKGQGGKISSSTGNVISLKDVLEVYEPEIVRYLFAGTRPNTEFAISFDLDVIKIYEDYDKCERVYYGLEDISEKKKEKQQRIYELSQVNKPEPDMPFQLPFRHLCNLLQINDGNIDAVLNLFSDMSDVQRVKASRRAKCAWNWIELYAPEDFRFRLQGDDTVPASLSDAQLAAIIYLGDEIRLGFENHDEKTLAEFFYKLAEDTGLEPKDLFKTVYTVLIGKERGPRLAGFIMAIGKQKISAILERYRKL